MKLKRVLDGFDNFGPEDAVDLNDCSLDDAAFLPLLRRGAFPFKMLLLDNNKLTDRTAASLATVLCSSPALSTLSLRANKVGDCGAKALSRWVETTKAASLELDLRGTEVKDDGVHRLCVAARRTFRPSMKSLRLERMGLQGLGGIVDFLESPASTKLESLRCTVVDLDTLHMYREEVSAEDFDTASYAKPKEEVEGENGEEDEELPNEELRNRLEEEAESVGEASVTAPPSPELLHLVERVVKAVENRPALVDVEVCGIPERYSDEIRWIIADRTDKAANSPKKSLVESLTWERNLVTDMVNELSGPCDAEKGIAADTRISPNVSLRSYIGRTLDVALGDALFECQWHKAMGNQAVADGKGEMAFIARFLRRALKSLATSDYIEKALLAEDRVVYDGMAKKENVAPSPAPDQALAAPPEKEDRPPPDTRDLEKEDAIAGASDEIAPEKTDAKEKEDGATAAETAEKEEMEAPIAEEKQEGETETPAAKEKQEGEAETPAAEEKQEGDAEIPAAEETKEGEAETPAPEEKQEGDAEIPAAEETKEGEAETLAPEEKQEAETKKSSAEEKQEGETETAAAEEKQDGEAETPAAEQQEGEAETPTAEAVETAETMPAAEEMSEKKDNEGETVEAKADETEGVADSSVTPAEVPAEPAVETVEANAIPDEVAAPAPEDETPAPAEE